MVVGNFKDLPSLRCLAVLRERSATMELKYTFYNI